MNSNDSDKQYLPTALELQALTVKAAADNTLPIVMQILEKCSKTASVGHNQLYEEQCVLGEELFSNVAVELEGLGYAVWKGNISPEGFITSFRVFWET